MDSIAANPKVFAGFTTFHPIEFNGFDHFAAQVIIVSLGHWAKSAVDGFLIVTSLLIWWLLYKARHLIENFFAKLKQYRAIATRYDKRATNFLGAIYLAASVIWLI